MLKHKLLLLTIVVLQSIITSAQKVSNVTMRQEQSTIVVSYDLETEEPCKISLYVSTDGGTNWTGPLTQVTGDVGDKVESGNHNIVWSVLEEYNELLGENIKFRVDAEQNIKSDFNDGFSSLGLQSGQIAKYGFLYERGGRKTLGFHIAVRSSFTPEEDIINGAIKENKAEFDLGPNFKIFKRIYLNIGVGYGYYRYRNVDDYAHTTTLNKAGYLVTSGGLMIRLSRLININGGVSFMDINKEFYTPEFIFGLSFNLRGRYK